MLIYNVSGLAISIEHSGHHVRRTENSEHQKSKAGSEISQDNNCQCALHFQMNHSLGPDLAIPDFSFIQDNKNEIPQPEVITYTCLLDYFSSRAPPSFS